MKDSQFWDVLVPRAMSTYAIAVFAVLWIGFAIALIANREWLGTLWTWIQALPTLARTIIWVLFLPITVGLWVWESSWSSLTRLLSFAGIAVWTLVALNSFIKALRLGG